MLVVNVIFFTVFIDDQLAALNDPPVKRRLGAYWRENANIAAHLPSR